MIILIIFIIAFIGFIFNSFNKAQGQSQEVMQSHSNIMVSMKKRADLVNKLMDITLSYGEHEKLTHITVKHSENSNLAYANSKIDGAIMEINSIARNFPELKANETYQQLMSDLNRIEDGIESKRERFNETVKMYNKGITSIPFMFFAAKLGFKPASYFDVSTSDNLENMKDFKTNDGEALKDVMKQITNNTIHIAQEASKVGKDLINKKIQKKEIGIDNAENDGSLLNKNDQEPLPLNP